MPARFSIGEVVSYRPKRELFARTTRSLAAGYLPIANKERPCVITDDPEERDVSLLKESFIWNGDLGERVAKDVSKPRSNINYVATSSSITATPT